VVAGTIRPVTWLVAALMNNLDAPIIVLLPAPTASARASMATFEQLGALGRAEEQLRRDVLEAGDSDRVSASRHLLLDGVRTSDGCQVERLVARHLVMDVAAW
jgi:hypothetical protein